jgi:hypothetical protein
MGFDYKFIPILAAWPSSSVLQDVTPFFDVLLSSYGLHKAPERYHLFLSDYCDRLQTSYERAIRDRPHAERF